MYTYEFTRIYQFYIEKAPECAEFWGPAAEGGGPYEYLIPFVSFYFLKDSQTSLLRRRRGRIYGASPSAAGPLHGLVARWLGG